MGRRASAFGKKGRGLTSSALRRPSLPDGLPISEVRIQDLPAEWRRQPGPLELQDIGTRCAEAGKTVCLSVPSAVVPGEHDFLLNPRHRDFGRLAIGKPEPLEFDQRLVETR